MKYWKILFFSLLSTLGVINCEGNLAEIKEQYPNRFAAGLNLSHVDLNINLDRVKVKGNHAFSGIYIGYEYRKPDGIYVLFDVRVSGSDRRFSVNAKDLNYNHSMDLNFGRSSLLFGYTNTYCNLLWTPYVGFGSFLIRNESTIHSKLEERLRYFTIGVKCDYSINDCFDLGANLQLFAICGIKEYRIKNFNDNGDFLTRSYFESNGLSFSFPITYHYGETMQWEIKVKPYYTVIAFRQNQHTYGANLVIGYNF